MSKLLNKSLTKATTAEGDQRRYGPSWLLSRRGFLKVFDDHLECGDWRLDYSEIKNAVLFSFRSTSLLPGYILSVETKDRTYHFGLNGWSRFWKGDLPFPVRREKGRLGFTWFSIVVRLALLAGVAYVIWQWIAS